MWPFCVHEGICIGRCCVVGPMLAQVVLCQKGSDSLLVQRDLAG